MVSTSSVPPPAPPIKAPDDKEQPEPGVTETAADLADFTSVRQAIELLLLPSELVTDPAGFEKLVRKAKFTEIEYALLLQFRSQFTFRQRKMASQEDTLALESLILQFGVPSEVIQTAMAGLYGKLLALLPRKR